MQLVKYVLTALYFKERLTLLLVAAHYLLVSKLLVKVGALHTLRKLNSLKLKKFSQNGCLVW
jgi:hypothetical protein